MAFRRGEMLVLQEEREVAERIQLNLQSEAISLIKEGDPKGVASWGQEEPHQGFTRPTQALLCVFRLVH